MINLVGAESGEQSRRHLVPPSSTTHNACLPCGNLLILLRSLHFKMIPDQVLLGHDAIRNCSGTISDPNLTTLNGERKL